MNTFKYIALTVIIILCIIFFIYLSLSLKIPVTQEDFKQMNVVFKVFESLGYFYALSIENRIMNAKNEKELESIIFYFRKKQIDPVKSFWGSGYRLKNNEKMVQYLILYTNPLDVVYYDKGVITKVYTSYE